MNISNCTTYVFTRQSQPDFPLRSVLEEPSETACIMCAVCGQGFDQDEALKAHFQAPALPASSSSSFACGQCTRVFLSQRALEQHSASCSAMAHQETVQTKKSGYSAGLHGADVVSELVIDTEGERLWHFTRQSEALRKHLPTKASAKRAIAEGELTLNGLGAEESRILHRGDVVQLRLNKMREAQDAGATRAKSVRLVAFHKGIVGLSEAPWQVLRAICPPDVAIVWKPSGMRSRGEHPGTLQTSVPLMPEISGCVPMPLSRLEIGCSGLCLVALTEKSRSELKEQLVAGGVYHVFKALVHGFVGSPGEIQRLDFRTAQPETSNVSPLPKDDEVPAESSGSEHREPNAALKWVHLRVAWAPKFANFN